MLKEELDGLLDKLTCSEKVIELVRLMDPQDVLIVISKDLGLCGSDAQSLTTGLVQRANEGICSPSIERGARYQFPVSPKTTKEKPLNSLTGDDGEEDNIHEDFVNNLGMMSPNMDRNQFPPDPRPEDEGWPYDGCTKAYMDPKNKGRKRGHTT